MRLPDIRQEEFAQGISRGLSKQAAYVAAYPGTTKGSARVGGSRLSQRPEVQRRIAELLDQPAPDQLEEITALTTERNAVLAKLDAMAADIDLVQKKTFLTMAIATPISEIDENSPLCQEVTITTTTDKEGNVTTKKRIKAVNKLQALKIHAELSGELNKGTTVNIDNSKNLTVATPSDEALAKFLEAKEVAEGKRLARLSQKALPEPSVDPELVEAEVV